jgi:hypothetical protein
MKRSLVSCCVMLLAGLGCGADESVSGGFMLGGSVAVPGGATAGTGGTGGGGPGATAGGLTAGGTSGGLGGTSGGGLGSTAGSVGGTGAGIGGTAGNAGGATGGICQSSTVQTERVTPDMLIVLDRSLSMQQGSRWAPSVSGLKAITAALQSSVGFGLMAFPGTSGGSAPVDCFALGDVERTAECLALQDLGGTGLTCTTGNINVPIGYNNAAAIAQALDGMAPDGATPTAATLQAARAELDKIVAGPDQLAAPKYVLLVTDGSPNCSNGSLGAGAPDLTAVSASVSAIQAMAQNGIKTYVLGYDTQSDATLRANLDQMARAGGTGDTVHRAIENESGLIAAFQQITTRALSCEFALDKQVIDKTFVRVLLDGAQLGVDDANGWVLSTDRRKVRVQGTACNALSSVGHTLNVTVECEPVPPPI